MTCRRMLLGLVAALATTLAVAAGSQAAPAPVPGPGPGQSMDQCFYNHLGFENYGPTDVNVQAGDTRRRVTVNENAAGTVTTFKWPNPSYYNQVKYLAVDRDADGKAIPQAPNHGAFVGIRYRTAEGPGFAWLRSWRSQQVYNSQDTAVPVSIYRSPKSLGLRVVGIDLVSGDTFQRQYMVDRRPGSPVSSAQLIAYENFNPVATRKLMLPLVDSCLTWLSDQHARYAPGSHAILNWWEGVDEATRQPSSVALAMGFDGPDVGHQVGADGFDPGADPNGPADPYLQLDQPGHRLGGNTEADGQTVGALAAALHFDRHGRASARLTVAAAKTRPLALRTLGRARKAGFARLLRTDARQWHNWLGRSRLPKSTDPRTINVAKRALISLRLAMVPKTGAIVASAATQGPYGEDWIRDGAFFNETLDLNGFTGAVTRHNRFYARIQASPDNPSAQRPDGNWAEGSYGDGLDGLPIAWEIDETGLGVWTLYRHANFLKGKAKRAYLADVYPAIARAADFLTTCRDPVNELQCVAHEDDNNASTQTIHGAQTTVLALRSAIRAAGLVGDSSPRVESWRSRLVELRAAIERELFDPVTLTYLQKAGSSQAASYQDQGWLLWPVLIKPRTDPAMQATASNVRKGVSVLLNGARGSYELKGVLGLAHQWSKPTARQASSIKQDLSYIARQQTTPTGLLGEAWQRFSNGWPTPVQDMPHVWMHTLFYLAAVKAYGPEPYRFQRSAPYTAKFPLWRPKKKPR